MQDTTQGQFSDRVSIQNYTIVHIKNINDSIIHKCACYTERNMFFGRFCFIKSKKSKISKLILKSSVRSRIHTIT